MRGKLLVWGYLVVLSFATIANLYMPKTEAAAKESIVIPGEAIRLRILANSDFEKDQQIKRKVRDAVNAQITFWIQDLTSMEQARKVMNERLPEIQAIAEKVVRSQGSTQSVKVEFGKVQFPTKLYGQFLYPAGKYQAILITLGEGEGANWWCVLYPPLCFLDFSNGVAVGEGFDERKTAAAEEPAGEEAKSAAASAEGPVEQTAKNKEEPKTSDTKENKHKEAKEEVQSSKRPKEKVQSPKRPEEEVESPKRPIEEVEPTEKPALDESDTPSEKASMPKKAKKEKEAPVYVAEDEQPVKVKFFVVEMWKKIFD